MSKYDALNEFLGRLQADYWRPTFLELERLLEFKLPASARSREAWWANEPGGRSGHTRAWLDAGWRVQEVSLDKERVTFVKGTATAPAQAETNVAGAARSLRERASELADWASGRRDFAVDQLRERPLTYVGISAGAAFAAGIALGYLLVRAGAAPAASAASATEHRAKRALSALAAGVHELEGVVGEKLRRLRG